MKPRVCILRTAGTNCDKETAFAFEAAGGDPELVHVNRLISSEKSLDNYHILVLPGGFSYGDDIAAGKILANELRCKLNQGLKRFIAAGKLIIGICNGFQILVKSGLLPGNDTLEQETSLIINDCGSFLDEWVYLKVTRSQSHKSQVKCVWAKDLPEEIYLPIAHGEGKFVVRDKQVLARLKKNNQIVFKYSDNPNGSLEDIAGICDDTGRILGLMPHPERHIDIRQHPRWEKTSGASLGHGFLIIKNGVEYAKNNLRG
ncbi:MAG: phosphoribosylformylglycinamidine synthase I [Candidatus Omnitrophica bacterium]|nr:phosphoribosylformylglycinamidine synthase I [Candidatus Omnitrophota bacterium]